ncbi:hypothetical protein AB1L88_25100 [Tautonia sp. JC769]|uniref:hypothetical protein n=1 Tax=Tautonia sp. JC769 TaxID=3232135 RepID=UPI0034588530
MFSSTTYKVAGLGLLGVLSYTISALALARPSAVPDDVPLKVEPVRQVMRPAEQGAVPGPGVVGTYGMNRLSMESSRGLVTVDAAATLWDRRDGMRFVWSFRVLDPEDDREVVFEDRYDGQVFSITPGQSSTMTFADIISPDIPKGRYPAEVVIYGLEPGEEVSGLDDSKKARSSILATGKSHVVID